MFFKFLLARRKLSSTLGTIIRVFSEGLLPNSKIVFARSFVLKELILKLLTTVMLSCFFNNNKRKLKRHSFLLIFCEYSFDQESGLILCNNFSCIPACCFTRELLIDLIQKIKNRNLYEILLEKLGKTGGALYGLLFEEKRI